MIPAESLDLGSKPRNLLAKRRDKRHELLSGGLITRFVRHRTPRYGL